MRTFAYALCILIGASSAAVALKWSDRDKVDAATKAIAMADNLAASAPLSITVRVNMADSDHRDPAPEVTLTQGAAFDNILAQVTTKLNNDKATAQSYLASVGVTND